MKLSSVIRCDGKKRHVTLVDDANQAGICFSYGSGLQSADVEISRLPFYQRENAGTRTFTQDGIDLPVTDATSVINVLWTVVDHALSS